VGQSVSTGGSTSAGGGGGGGGGDGGGAVDLSSLGTLSSNFFFAALLAVSIKPGAAAEATQQIATGYVVAFIVPLIFLGLIFACARPACNTKCDCCCAMTEEDDTKAYKKTAPIAKLRFMGAAYCFAQGLALIAAGLFSIPWINISADITLPLLGLGLAACSSGTTIDALAKICTGGTLATTGSAIFYLSLVLGLTAFILAWSLTIRTRNLSRNSLPKSACCGTVPAALYVGATAALLSFLGVIIAWMGYNSYIGLIPPAALTALKVTVSPGGVAVIIGLLFHLGGIGTLVFAQKALQPAVPFMMGATALACKAITFEVRRGPPRFPRTLSRATSASPRLNPPPPPPPPQKSRRAKAKTQRAR
jgi:hypothetical protein